MDRRRVLASAVAPIVVALAGCGADRPGRPTGTATAGPTTVTTTAGAAVTIRAVQVVVRDGETGPRVHYRLRNDGSGPATVEVTTVLHVEDGGSYEAAVFVDIDAGSEVVLEYELVRWARLSSAERRAVERGAADFDVYVNGQRRPV